MTKRGTHTFFSVKIKQYENNFYLYRILLIWFKTMRYKLLLDCKWLLTSLTLNLKKYALNIKTKTNKKIVSTDISLTSNSRHPSCIVQQTVKWRVHFSFVDIGSLSILSVFWVNLHVIYKNIEFYLHIRYTIHAVKFT